MNGKHFARYRHKRSILHECISNLHAVGPGELYQIECCSPIFILGHKADSLEHFQIEVAIFLWVASSFIFVQLDYLTLEVVCGLAFFRD